MADPCETCLRWPECNGVDVLYCPLCEAPPQWPKTSHHIDEKTESGLFEEE